MWGLEQNSISNSEQKSIYILEQNSLINSEENSVINSENYSISNSNNISENFLDKDSSFFNNLKDNYNMRIDKLFDKEQIEFVNFVKKKDEKKLLNILKSKITEIDPDILNYCLKYKTGFFIIKKIIFNNYYCNNIFSIETKRDALKIALKYKNDIEVIELLVIGAKLYKDFYEISLKNYDFYEKLTIIKLLLRKCEDFIFLDNLEKKCLGIELENKNNIKIIKLLIEKWKIFSAVSNFNILKIVLENKNNIKIIEFLLEKFENLNYFIDENEKTLLEIALKNQIDIKIIKLMIEKGSALFCGFKLKEDVKKTLFNVFLENYKECEIDFFLNTPQLRNILINSKIIGDNLGYIIKKYPEINDKDIFGWEMLSYLYWSQKLRNIFYLLIFNF